MHVWVISVDKDTFSTHMCERRGCRSYRDARLEMDTTAEVAYSRTHVTSLCSCRELHASTSSELGIIYEGLKPSPASPYTQATMALFHQVRSVSPENRLVESAFATVSLNVQIIAQQNI